MKIRKNTNPDTKCVSKPSGLDKFDCQSVQARKKTVPKASRLEQMKKVSGGGGKFLAGEIRGGPGEWFGGLREAMERGKGERYTSLLQEFRF